MDNLELIRRLRMQEWASDLPDSFGEDGAADTAWWLTKTPSQRLAGLELMRQIEYGYDGATTRMDRSVS